MYSFFPRIEKMLRDKIMSWRPRFVTRWNRLVVKFQCLNLGPMYKKWSYEPMEEKEREGRKGERGLNPRSSERQSDNKLVELLAIT